MKVIITELAVFDVVDTGLRLRELAPELTLLELREMTDARFEVSPRLVAMGLPPVATA